MVEMRNCDFVELSRIDRFVSLCVVCTVHVIQSTVDWSHHEVLDYQVLVRRTMAAER